jgi:hypothetical protein
LRSKFDPRVARIASIPDSLAALGDPSLDPALLEISLIGYATWIEGANKLASCTAWVGIAMPAFCLACVLLGIMRG